MKLNYFRAAEQEIASLPDLKRSLVYLKRKQTKFVNSGKPGTSITVDFSKPYTDSHTVNDTLNDLLAVKELSAEIKETENEIERIEDILKELEEEQRNVLEMFYIEALSAAAIAEKIHVESDKTVYNIRNKAIERYCLISYGVKAISPRK